MSVAFEVTYPLDQVLIALNLGKLFFDAFHDLLVQCLPTHDKTSHKVHHTRRIISTKTPNIKVALTLNVNIFTKNDQFFLQHDTNFPITSPFP